MLFREKLFSGIYWGMIASLAFGIFLVYLKVSYVGYFSPAKFSKMLEGTADRPFAYRVLTPLSARTLAPLVPDQVISWFSTFPIETIRISFVTLDGSIYPREAVVALILMYASLVGFSVIVFKWLRYLKYSTGIQHLGTVFLLAGVILLTFFNGYIYDLPQLFLFSLGLYLLSKKHWLRYLFVFIVVTLNKETSILLTLVFVWVYFRNIPTIQFWRLLVFQAGIFIIIRGTVMFLFRNNPGGIILWHLENQIQFFKSYPIILIGLILILGAIAYLISIRFYKKPLYVRSALIILPFLIGLYIIGGYPMEFRVFLELYPLIGILILPPPYQIEMTTKNN